VTNKSDKEGFYQNKETLMFGGEEVKIFQTANSAGKWHMRYWISKEKKAYQRSLRTTHLPTARAKAEEIYLDQIRPKLKEDKKIFPTNFYDALNQYIAEKEKAVGKKGKSGIKEGRFTTIKSQLKHIKEYIGEDCVMDVLHANSFSEYAQYRDEQGAAQSTIMNEQATLNSFCKFSREQGWINIERFKVDEISKEGVDNQRIARQTFSDAEYTAIYNDLKSYASKTRIKQDKLNEADAWTRQLFRHYCLIAANTGMRTGELWKLQWENVKVREAETEKGKLVAEITVLAETTKVGKQRTFVARGGEHFKRLRELSPFNKKSDYVFTLADGRTWSGDNRRSFDYQYHKLMERVGIEDWKYRNLTSYAFRHYAITTRIVNGANLAILARDMGTSITQFEKTYFHVNMIDSERNTLVRRDKKK